jgi:asparagine synthase (glutamine-hydrolysing)
MTQSGTGEKLGPFSEFDQNDLSVAIADGKNTTRFHSDEGDIIWIWGYIFGVHSNQGYVPRSSNTGTGEFCIQYLDRIGEVFERLNGQFTAIHYHPSKGLNIYTDRLGTHPIYYYKTDGKFVFSSNIQLLTQHPLINTELEDKYVREYLIYQRVFGEHTPLKHIDQVPPATQFHINGESSKTISKSTYWRPEYDPKNKSISTVVDEFTKLFQRIVKESTNIDDKYGIMLSSGTDSRLILAALSDLNRDITAFHFNESFNRNAEIAEKIASISDVDFKFLKRDERNLPNELKSNADLSNYIGQFHEARSTIFTEELSEVDTLITGWLADTFFKGYFAPGTDFQFTTAPEFLNHISKKYPTPQYISNTEQKIRTVVGGSKQKDSIQFHGISYPSISDFVNSFEFYPVTNQPDYLHYQGLQSITPTWLPYVDDRLLDFHLSISQKNYTNANIIKKSISKIHPELGDIEYNPPAILHDDDRKRHIDLPAINIEYPKISIKNLSDLTEILKLKILSTISSRQVSTGAWMDHPNIVQNSHFIDHSLSENLHILNNIDCVDTQEAKKMIDNFNGDWKDVTALYLLVTFIETPAVQDLYDKTN